jgi:hypothetical protein
MSVDVNNPLRERGGLLGHLIAPEMNNSRFVAQPSVSNRQLLFGHPCREWQHSVASNTVPLESASIPDKPDAFLI